MRQARQYARVYDNKIEVNLPWAVCCCCTTDQCIMDRVYVTHFDRVPFRAGLCCWCIPATCCGPPVIYPKSRGCIGGADIKGAPHSCCGLKMCLCLGPPCYTCFGSPLIPSVKTESVDDFMAGLAAAVDAYKAQHPDIQSEMATIVGGVPASDMDRGQEDTPV